VGKYGRPEKATDGNVILRMGFVFNYVTDYVVCNHVPF